MALTGESGCGDFRTLISGADKALYEAKETGRNRVVVHDRPLEE